MPINNTKKENDRQSPDHLAHPKYRPDIDGLRAVAVICVVVYHAFPNLLKGGFIGVDVFFVISGYLISSIIFGGLERGTFSFYDFYSRRIRRIFPALMLVLISCYAFGWFVLLADEYKQLGKHIAAGAGFISNLVLWDESGYFDVAVEKKPLLHLWSLGIEEQFYIIWPLILWASWKKNFNIFTISLVIFVASFVLNLTNYRVDGIANFYSPQTRFWELLAGSLLAYITCRNIQLLNQIKIKLDSLLDKIIYDNSPEKKGSTLSDAQSLCGSLLIALGLVLITKERNFPGPWAILPVLGAACIIAAGPSSWVNRVFLSNRLIGWFGVISYPLYLWHWPLISFARIIEGDFPSRSIRIAAVLLSIVLAWLTYKLIEHPLRFGGLARVKVFFLLVVMVLLGCVGYKTYHSNGLGFRVEQFNKVSMAAGEWEYPGVLASEKFNGIDYFIQYSKVKKSTIFIGDSNIEQFYPRVAELIKEFPEEVNTAIFKTGGGCFPVSGMKFDRLHSHCENLMRDALHLAVNMGGVESVVVGAQWNGYFLTGYGLDQSIRYGDDFYRAALSNISSFLSELATRNLKVYLILNIPTGNELDPKHIVHRRLEDFPNVFTLKSGGVDRSFLANKYGLIQSDLARIASEAGATVINPIDYLCGERCDSLDASGAPIYKDGAHLRPAFVRKYANFIDQTVRN